MLGYLPYLFVTQTTMRPSEDTLMKGGYLGLEYIVATSKDGGNYLCIPIGQNAFRYDASPIEGLTPGHSVNIDIALRGVYREFLKGTICQRMLIDGFQYILHMLRETNAPGTLEGTTSALEWVRFGDPRDGLVLSRSETITPAGDASEHTVTIHFQGQVFGTSEPLTHHYYNTGSDIINCVKHYYLRNLWPFNAL